MRPSARLVVITAAAALLLSSVAACAGPGPSSSSSARPGSRTGAECPVGAWVVDIQNLEQQVVDAVPENIEVVGHSSSGTQKWTFTAHHLSIASDFSISVTEEPEAGHELQVSQHHSGTVQMDWALDGTDMSFSHYDAGDGAVTTTEVSEGTTIEGAPVPLASQNPFEPGFETVCRGAGMTITTNGTEFTSHLSRAGGH